MVHKLVRVALKPVVVCDV